MYLRFRALHMKVIALCSVFVGAGCTAPVAQRADEFFGGRKNLGFATGHLMTIDNLPDNSAFHNARLGSAFSIGPGVIVTAGHCFQSSVKAGYRGLGYREGPLPASELKHKVIINDSPECLWKKGEIMQLVRPDVQAPGDIASGDFALIRTRNPLSQWDECIDPSFRPSPGDIIVVGSRHGRADDRVLRVIKQPISCKEFSRCLRAESKHFLGIPENVVFAEPELGPGWSGSPAKAYDKQSGKWLTFGYVIAGATPNSLVRPFQVIVPLPDDILAYRQLSPIGDDPIVPYVAQKNDPSADSKPEPVSLLLAQ